MRTRVYVDGYNLYYGCLKFSPYKWLDLEILFAKYILPSVYVAQTPLFLDAIAIKYFTAEIIDKAAADFDSRQDQITYHNALQAYSKNRLQIYKGYYSVTQVSAFRVEGKKLPRDSSRVEIWKLEEKQSDVNLAIEALFDAMTEENLQQVVFVSNDTDLAASMKKIKEYNPTRLAKGWKPIQIGLVIPTRSANSTNNSDIRRPNKTLSLLVDWTVKSISSEWLARSQLPYKVPVGRRPAIIPVSWHPLATALLPIMAELRQVLKLGECWKWLETPKPKIAGLEDLSEITPLEVLNTKEGAQNVLEHAKKYREWKKGKKA